MARGAAHARGTIVAVVHVSACRAAAALLVGAIVLARGAAIALITSAIKVGTGKGKRKSESGGYVD